MRVLVVCHANVTRSVAAAYLLGEAGGSVVPPEVRSAGTHVHEGQPVSSRTQQALSRVLGAPADLGGHRAHQLVEGDLTWAELVVTMEASQVRLVRRMPGGAAARTATLGLLARELPSDERPVGLRIASMALHARELDDRDDVADPAGGDDDAYEATMVELVELCGSLAPRISD